MQRGRCLHLHAQIDVFRAGIGRLRGRRSVSEAGRILNDGDHTLRRSIAQRGQRHIWQSTAG